jgi:4-hydroxythreonine-4-phosphate dehydrogenase
VKKPLRIAITTGDIDGIGMEVVSKALSKFGPRAGVQFLLWRAPSASKRDLRRIDSEFRRRTVSTWPEALAHQPSSHKELIDINSKMPPALWVQHCAEAAMFGHIDGMATAPLSKTSIKAAGLKDLGHTDILRRISGVENLFMGFVGKHLAVVLATDHVPIAKVPFLLNSSRLTAAIAAADLVRKWLPEKKSRLPVGLLGLNPHAGENGLIGEEELLLFGGAASGAARLGIPLEGPLVADAAFSEERRERISVFVASYHDQGLIPFKMLHSHRGVHITLGLPFVRTSVDHGTAKDIFGKNRAEYGSMLEALKWAIALSRKDGDTKTGA